ETVLVLTADLLRRAGHEVVPFAVAEERTLPTPVRGRLPTAAGSRARTGCGEAWAGTWSPRSYRALAAVVDEVRPDVAHVHHVFERLTTSVLDALRRRAVPTVMTLHDYKPVCPNYRLFTEGAPCTRCLSGRYRHVVQHRCLEGSRWRPGAAARIRPDGGPVAGPGRGRRATGRRPGCAAAGRRGDPAARRGRGGAAGAVGGELPDGGARGRRPGRAGGRLVDRRHPRA